MRFMKEIEYRYKIRNLKDFDKIKDILEFLEDFENEKEQIPNNDEIEEEEYLEEIHKINENDFNIE